MSGCANVIPAIQVSTGSSDQLNNVSIDASFGFIRYDTTNHNLEVYEENGWKDIVINDKPAIDISGKLVVDGDVSIASTGALTIPVGETIERPTAAAIGMVRFNSTLDMLEFYNGSLLGWRRISTGAMATGGTVTEVGPYRIHTFTETALLMVLTLIGGGNVEYLVVAGGGGGAGRDIGGGGGAGGMRTGSTQLNAGSYNIIVGSGGGGSLDSQNPITTANQGSDSSFNSIVCKGGGAGWNHMHATATYSEDFFNGGSGGGGCGLSPSSEDWDRNVTGGIGTVDQGFDGGDGRAMNAGGDYYGGGGGGGAGQIGKSAIYGRGGGDGIQSDITGTNIYYAGGGGGAGHRTHENKSLGPGGLGGGGPATAGELSTTTRDGTDGLGGGGGAARGPHPNPIHTGGDGGNGIVIIRYLL